MVNTNKMGMFCLKKWLLIIISLYRIFEHIKKRTYALNMHTYVFYIFSIMER